MCAAAPTAARAREAHLLLLLLPLLLAPPRGALAQAPAAEVSEWGAAGGAVGGAAGGAAAGEQACGGGGGGSVASDSWHPRSADVFNQLTLEELGVVQAYLTAALDLHDPTATPGMATPLQNFLSRIELLPAPKEAALAHLDGLTGEAPPRYARATVARGAARPRDVMEYRVGPLPLDPATATLEELRAPGEVPFTKRPLDVTTASWPEAAVGQVGGWEGGTMVNGESMRRAASPPLAPGRFQPARAVSQHDRRRVLRVAPGGGGRNGCGRAAGGGE